VGFRWRSARARGSDAAPRPGRRPSCARPALTGLLVWCALALAVVGPAGQEPVFRGRVDLVNLGVTVTDRRGQLLTDLTVDDFEIIEDGRRQSIRHFATGERDSLDQPADLHLGVLLDVSGSMTADIGFMRTASIKFLNAFSDAVDITLVDFDTQVRVARYAQADFARLVERIRRQKLGTYTAMYDAVGVYLDGAADQDGRKVMLLYTDGGDTRSALRLGDLIDLLKASDVTVYAIGALDHRSGSAEPRMVLQQIAEATGGQAYFPQSVKELDKIYAQIEAEIRAQYTLGYVSANEKADGAWRKVEIKMVHPSRKDARVRSRKGYFARFKADSRP
jgi:Ca-activated chloride channel homolog